VILGRIAFRIREFETGQYYLKTGAVSKRKEIRHVLGVTSQSTK
jgi:hypothetical protein